MVYVVLMLAACGGFGEPAAPEAPPPEAAQVAAPAVDPAAEAAALARANDAASLLGKTLKSRLMGAMSSGGPGAAAAVCADEAQAITAQVRGESGVAVGRASARLRNPSNAGPDWVKAWLAEAEGKPAAQAAALSQIVDTPEGRRARVLRPIEAEAPCLVCHGPAEAVPAEVQALLGERYPGDAATGYAPGDLRGALWAEAPVEPGS